MQVHPPILVYERDFLTEFFNKDGIKKERTFVHFAGRDVKSPPPELCVAVTNWEEGQKLLDLLSQHVEEIHHQARIEEHARLHQEQK